MKFNKFNVDQNKINVQCAHCLLCGTRQVGSLVLLRLLGYAIGCHLQLWPEQTAVCTVSLPNVSLLPPNCC